MKEEKTLIVGLTKNGQIALEFEEGGFLFSQELARRIGKSLLELADELDDLKKKRH